MTSPEPDRSGPPPAAPEPPKPAWWDDIVRLARAYKHLFGAQLELLTSELGLARSAIHWLLAAGLLATVVGVGLGLTVLAIIGVALTQWLGTPLRALLVLGLLEIAALLGAIVLFRRCLHWLSLPRSRFEWHALARDTLRKTKRRIDSEDAP